MPSPSGSARSSTATSTPSSRSRASASDSALRDGAPAARPRLAGDDRALRPDPRPDIAARVGALPAAHQHPRLVPLDPKGPLSNAAWAKENLARAKQTL